MDPETTRLAITSAVAVLGPVIGFAGALLAARLGRETQFELDRRKARRERRERRISPLLDVCRDRLAVYRHLRDAPDDPTFQTRARILFEGDPFEPGLWVVPPGSDLASAMDGFLHAHGQCFFAVQSLNAGIEHGADMLDLVDYSGHLHARIDGLTDALSRLVLAADDYIDGLADQPRRPGIRKRAGAWIARKVPNRLWRGEPS